MFVCAIKNQPTDLGDKSVVPNKTFRTKTTTFHCDGAMKVDNIWLTGRLIARDMNDVLTVWKDILRHWKYRLAMRRAVKVGGGENTSRFRVTVWQGGISVSELN